MMQTQLTAPTLTAERVRRLRTVLETMMTERYGEAAPIVATIRRNLARAEAVRDDQPAPDRPDSGEARR